VVSRREGSEKGEGGKALPAALSVAQNFLRTKKCYNQVFASRRRRGGGRGCCSHGVRECIFFIKRGGGGKRRKGGEKVLADPICFVKEKKFNLK